MNRMKIYLLSFLMMAISSYTLAQTVKYSVTDSTKMTVSGTSTLHDWTSKVTEINGFVEVDEKFAKSGKVKKGDEIYLVSVQVPVKSIISPRGATMDKKTYEALKAEEHPEIIFNLKNSPVASVNGEVFTITAQGELTIAGVTKEVVFQVEGKQISAERMSFTGSYKINMTEYDMTPPSAMFGQIVTGEEVVIGFELVVNK